VRGEVSTGDAHRFLVAGGRIVGLTGTIGTFLHVYTSLLDVQVLLNVDQVVVL
jgi:fatty acid-binding protein DegV